MYRSYQQIIADLDRLSITFTSRGKYRSRSAFASAARYWSASRYQRELRTAQRNTRLRIQYQEARQFVSPSEARRLSQLSSQRFREAVSLRRTLREPDDIPRQRVQENKLENWRRWASNEDYPAWIEDEVDAINVQNGFDVNDKYGWAVMYYHYVYGINIETVMRYMDSDPLDGDIYTELLSEAGLI